MSLTVLFACALAVLLLVLLLWRIPRRQVRDIPGVEERVELEIKARSSLAQIIGGAGLLVSIYATLRGLEINQATLQSSLENVHSQLAIAQRTLRVSEEQLVTDRFSRAIDLLGRESATERVGAIFSLRDVARFSPERRDVIGKILSTFVRERSHWSGRESEYVRTRHELPVDIQAALFVVGERGGTGDRCTPIDLFQTELIEARLSAACLRAANLAYAHLEAADLTGADLRDARLQFASLGDCDLTDADLRGADIQNTDFSGAMLKGTDLRETNLYGALGLTLASIEEARYDEPRLPKALRDQLRKRR